MTNPFEIKLRLSSVSAEENKSNTSDYFIRDKSIDTTDIVVPVSIESVNSGIKSEAEKSNPFDVDHVPFRKVTRDKYIQSGLANESTAKTKDNFLFWYLLLSVVILAFIINIQYKSIGNIIKSMTNVNILKLFKREEEDRVSLTLWFLYLGYFINFAVFLYLLGYYWNLPFSLLSYVRVLTIVVVYYLFRHAGLYIIGRLYQVSDKTSMYSFSEMTAHLFLGMVLIPFNFLMAFGPDFMKFFWLIFVLISMVIFYFTKILRGLMTVSGHIYSYIFQIIIYLCAFEVAPLLIMLKFLMNNGTQG